MAGKSLGATFFESTMAGEAQAPVVGLESELHRGAGVSRYMLLERVGAGGMGVVWAAYDPELDRKVAIKLLRPRRGAEGRGAEARTRLLREAQAMARLSHPHVIPVHDVGEHGGQIFVAMEFVEGHTLGAWVRAQGERRDWRTIVAMFIQAGRGLAAAHDAGLIHRDFKPDNVLVGRDGRARVTDFGLARSVEAELIDEGEMATTAEVAATGETGETGGAGGTRSSGAALQSVLTRTGIMLGTPAYMAPEQFAAGSFDARSDQFSFCVALWEALYDQRPFAGRTVPELSAAVIEGKLRVAPAECRVPSFIHNALRRGLSVDPAARWPDLASLLLELERDPSLGRRRLVVGGGLAACLLGALAVAPALAERHHAVDVEVCPAADAQLEGVWDPQVREAVHGNFFTDGHEAVEGIAVMHGLDRYANQWLAMHKDACEDTNVRHELSPAILDKRMQCLEERRLALGAATELLANGSQLHRDAMNLLAHLPSVERCGDLDYLEAQMPMPDDRELAVEVEAIRVELAKLRAQVDIGEGREAIAPLTELLARAEALGYPPLRAQVLAELGFASAGGGDPAEIRVRLEEAVIAAVRTGQDELAARAGTELIYVVGWRLEEVPAALRWAELVTAWNERTHAPPAARAQLLIVEGLVRTRGGMPGAPKVLEGLALLGVDESLGGLDRLEAAEATTAGWGLNFLGIAAYSAGDHARACEVFRAGQRLRARLVGDDDPSVALFSANLSESAFMLGNWGEAARLHASLVPRAEELGRDTQDLAEFIPSWTIHQEIAHAQLLGEPACSESVRATIPALAAVAQRTSIRVVLAEALRVCGDLEGAAATMAALTPVDQSYAPGNYGLWFERGNLALALGRPDEARDAYQNAIDYATKSGRREQLAVADALAGLAAVAQAEGDDDEARAKLREALAIDDTVHPDGHPASVVRLEALADLEPARANELRARASQIRERVRYELADV